MNKHAQTLGLMAAGCPKNYSPQELGRRIARLVMAREAKAQRRIERNAEAILARAIGYPPVK